MGLLFKRMGGGKKGIPMPGVFEPEGFASYLRDHFAGYRYEVLEFFFIDPDGNILLRKSFTNKERSSVEIVPAELTKLVMQNAKNSLVLAHNHVRGGCMPSAVDDSLTKQCTVLCSINNVRLLDHFICAGEDVYSYYESGKMKEISKEYHIHTLLQEKK